MIRVEDLCDQYETWADGYYRKPSGKPTRHANNVRDALRLLRQTVLEPGPYRIRVARLRLDQFTPAVLRAIQQHQDAAGKVTRKTINARIAEIRRCFAWAAERELVPDQLVQRLERVRHLKRGRCQAPEGKGRRPVPWDRVSDTLTVAPPMLATMIEIQWHTGMRPSEVVAMRWSLIEQPRSGPWIYYPPEDKSEHLRAPDQRKPIPLSPSCRTILRNHATRCDGDVLFPGRPPTKPINEVSYAQMLRRINRENGLRHWCPHQLRHAAATRFRREFGIEAARVLLGHRSSATTEIYAEADFERACQLVQQHG